MLAHHITNHGQTSLDRQSPEAGKDIGIEEVVFHDPWRCSKLFLIVENVSGPCFHSGSG